MNEIYTAVLEYLHKFKNEWDYLFLTDFKKNSNFIKWLGEYTNSKKFKNIIKEITVNPYLTIPTNWETYFNSLSRNQRKHYRRDSNRLENTFKVRFEVFSDNHDITLEEAMSSLIILHEKRWIQDSGVGVFSRKRFREFHNTIAKSFFNQGWLRLFLLRIDGSIKAALYTFEYDKILFGYQMGYDPNLSEYSIGRLMILWSVKYAIESNLDEYDFLRGRSMYKYQFTNDIRNNVSIFVSQNNFRGYLVFCYSQITSNIKSISKTLTPSGIWNYLHKKKYLRKMRSQLY